ncbi:MAG: hypothetical protein KAX80_08095 [Planctomycetes bacterium]|nr:hypothetical protein [Planctomycetota bacterium]
MSEEIKVVIILKDNRGSIGVQAPDCDPALEVFEGSLQAALERVPGLTEEALSRWAETPRYPKCESPLPSQKQPPESVRSARQPSAPREGAMQSLF